MLKGLYFPTKILKPESRSWCEYFDQSPLEKLGRKPFSRMLLSLFSNYYKQLLDEVSVISRIIKVEVGVISRSRRLRLITLTETSIILDVTKTESNNIFFLLYIERILSSCFDIKCFQSLCKLFLFLRFSQFFLFHVVHKLLLCHLRRPFCVCESLSSTINRCLARSTKQTWKSYFCFFTAASNSKRANLTWLPSEIMHRGHTWHDYPWPWVSFTWLLYNL